MSSVVQTKDPVLAVILVKQEDHAKMLTDHEARIRPLERLSAKLTTLAFLGAGLGAAIINFIFSRF